MKIRLYPAFTVPPAAALLLLFSAACGSLDELLGRQELSETLTEERADRYNFIRKNRNEETPVPRSVEEEIVERTPLTAAPKEEIAIPESGNTSTAALQLKSDVKSDPFYEDLILLNADEEMPVHISLNSAPLVDALPAFADILGFNFIADSEIKSVLTVNLDSIMTRRELWETLSDLLYVAGCSAKLEGQTVRIVPISKLGGQRDLRVSADASGSSEILFSPLRNLTAAAAVELIQPFCGAGSVVKAVTGQNALLISDDPANIAKLEEILEIIDSPKRNAWPRCAVHCRNVVPSTAAGELAALLPILGFTVDLTGGQSQEAGAVQLMGVDRLQLLIISAATEEALKEISEWAAILDSADETRQEHLYIYKVTNGKAEQLAQALSVMFNVSGGASITVDSEGTVGSSNTTRTISNSSNSNTSDGVDNLPNTLVDKDSSIFEEPVRIFADGVYNRLVIRTTPRCYAMIKAMLDRMDTVPSQVLIQVLLVEITLTDSTMFGVEFSHSINNGDADSLLQTNYDGLKPAEGAGEGFSYLISNPGNPEERFGYLRAKAGKSNLKVISSPQVLVASNSEATVQIGYSVPVLTQAITTTSSSGSMAQNFEYRDIGIILEIIPQVTSNNLISFEISQEISEAVTNTYSTIDSPMFSKRKIESTMTIANGRSMILGGLIQEKRKEDLNSLPIIADIPFINSLLGKTDNSVERTEVLMMITGFIIDERSPVEDMLNRYNESVRELNAFENDLEDEYRKDVAKLEEFKRSRAENEPIVIRLDEDESLK